MRDEIQRLAQQYQFFHWYLAFPDVFRLPVSNEKPENEQAGWSDGFDVVLGNPPWEKFTISDEEWFAGRDSEIAETKGKARRDKLIRDLTTKNLSLYQAYKQAKRDEELFAQVFSKKTGTYPLTGFKELNTYHLFVELAERIIALRGRTGIIVKTGIGSAENCLPLFKALTDCKQLVSLFDFVNKKPLFPSVQTVERFSLLTFTGRVGHPQPIRFATLCQDVLDLHQLGRPYTLTPEDIALMNPLNGACPLLKGERDAEIMRHLYRQFPILGTRDLKHPDEFWNVEYTAIFHMANDSGHFKRLEELEEMSLRVDADRCARAEDEDYWPLYEGKYLFLLDHHYGSFETVPTTKKYGRKAEAPSPTLEQLRNPSYEILPRYWFPKGLWLKRTKQKGLRADFQFLFRDVAGVYPDLRTAIGAICPAGPAGHKAPTLTLPSVSNLAADARRLLAFAAIFCSIPFDYVVRNKLYSKSLNLGTLVQIPMPPPRLVVTEEGERDTLRVALLKAALELSYTSWSLRTLGEALGVSKPFVYDSDRRFLLLREIDALSAHFYGLSREEFEYVLSTFETLRDYEIKTSGKYRTKSVILNIYDAMSDAMRTGKPYQTLLNPPPADARCCHSLREPKAV